MSTSLEIERKFDIPDDFSLPPLDEIGTAGQPHAFDLDATYFDTADLRLVRNRTILRRRRGGHDAGWHLKRPVGGDRSELQLPDAAQLPKEILDQIRVVVRGAPVEPIVRLRTRRVEVAVEKGGDRVLIALDSVEAEHFGHGTRRWRELEIEVDAGSRRLLDQLAEVVVAAGAQPSPSPSKLARALGERAPAQPQRSAGKAVERLAGYLRKQRDELIANDPLVREFDAEAVHDMRVAVRRLRSSLSTFRKADTRPLRVELKWLSDGIGAVRDGDVLADAFVGDIAGAEPDLVPSKVTRLLRQRLRRDTGAAREALGKALNSRRYFALLDDLDQLVDGPPLEVTGAWLRRRARKQLVKADAELGAALESGVDAELHEARKSYKKARYAVELAAGKRAKSLVMRLKALQEVLGSHQDSVVAAALIKELADEATASGEPEIGFDALYALEQQRAAEHLAEVPAVFAKAAKTKVRRPLVG